MKESIDKYYQKKKDRKGKHLMRFCFDELYNASDYDEQDDEADFTVISDTDEGIPQLKLPRKSNEALKSDLLELELDEELKRMLDELNLAAKMPQSSKKFLPLYTTVTKHSNKGRPLDNNITSLDDKFVSDSSQAVTLIASNLREKMQDLDRCNRDYVYKVKEEKQKIEQERKRREEEERKRREEEERKRREEEESKRKEEEERKKAEEEARALKEKEEAEVRKKQEEEQNKRKELEKQRVQLEQKRREQEEAKKGKGTTNFTAIEKEFLQYKARVISIKNDIVEPVKKDASLKSILSKHKRKINPKFGQLTNSMQQLSSIVRELVGLIDQTKPNALGYQWILNFIAKAIVSQAETEARVKPESALPLGKLTLQLLVRYPELKELLMTRFVKKCPFVIGYTCSVDTEEGRLRMGWKRNSGNKWEEETSYDERMGGMVTLYSMITRLPLPQDFISTHKHPLPISCSWEMLARISNRPVELLTNAHFVVLGYWWDAAAAQFLQAYGSQAQKLLALICNGLTSTVAEKKFVGAARLRILFEEWQMEGKIKSFPEMAA